jgi:hypothetical protein
MYLFFVVALMFVLPIGSVVADVVLEATPLSLALVGKWFVFWSVGVRLLSAGIKQVLQPECTARVVFGFKGGEALLVIRELGFANVAIGSVGVASLFFPAWMPAAALVGALFFGLAGVNHALQAHRGRVESIAMVSDLLAAVALLASLVGLLS